jgi:hypothetical protein
MTSSAARAPAAELGHQGLPELVLQFAQANRCHEIVQGMQAHIKGSDCEDPFCAVELPAACSVFRQTVQKALLLRSGVQHSLVDKQKLAGFLATPGRQDLLRNYARLWEEEWRLSWLSVLQTVDTATGGKGHRSCAHSTFPIRLLGSTVPTRRPWRMFPVRRLRRTATPQDDKRNANLVVSAMRSFFSKAIQMVHLEANEVLRLTKAFVEALVSDMSFMQCFSSSMIPEEQRHKEYRTEEDSLLGLTYMTLVLQTDLHNKKVGRKHWDMRKFMAAGKDIGVTPGLMRQIYKHVKKGPL